MLQQTYPPIHQPIYLMGPALLWAGAFKAAIEPVIPHGNITFGMPTINNELAAIPASIVTIREELK